MSTSEEEMNPYELLQVTLEATEAEIKTAYRQRSLKLHPDRNRDDPDAGRKFHELNQAYELLLDPLRRLALDAKQRLKEARKTRFAGYDAKRKNMVEELEERERAFKKARVEKAQEERARERETEHIREEGRRLREEREREMKRREEETEKAEAKLREELEPPALGHLDTTIRVKYPLSKYPMLTTASALSTFLARFGATDTDSIVLSMKRPKKSPDKPPKFATALVPFHKIGDAFAVVCAQGRDGLEDLDVGWAEGHEPAILGWLKKTGKLGPGSTNDKAQSPAGWETNAGAPAGILPQESESKSTFSTAFSSFPASFPDFSSDIKSAPEQVSSPALDFEALTLMRLRQAERERLEREIREQEAKES
ncbi:DnaJ-domain-containing protein [Dentipellis sp. KUC8613]|nr:DnaJ-domain-containing protein [Dentipellis sp. KUC8613]